MSPLVAFELNVREFRPEDLGKLNFYLEALDRDVKKPHERPSIGLLLCTNKDTEVVECAQPHPVAHPSGRIPDRTAVKGSPGK